MESRMQAKTSSMRFRWLVLCALATGCSGQATFEYVGQNLGIGGLGRVDKIRITSSNASGLPVGSEWACKRLNENWSQHPTMRERFEREIAALGRMSHTNIMTCEGQSLP